MVDSGYEPDELTDLATVRAGYASLTSIHCTVEVWGPDGQPGKMFHPEHGVHAASAGTNCVRQKLCSKHLSSISPISGMQAPNTNCLAHPPLSRVTIDLHKQLGLSENAPLRLGFQRKAFPSDTTCRFGVWVLPWIHDPKANDPQLPQR